MDVQYCYYEKDQGLEELQVKIFNYNMRALKTPDQVARAEEIKERYERENPDSKQIRFALTKDGKPLAYIQSRFSKENKVAIGYPWAMPECPKNVQEKLFDEMLSYLIKRRPKEINYWLYYKWEKQIDFFKRKHFVRKIKGIKYEFEIDKTSRINLPDSIFTSRLATEEDLDSLIEISLLDEDMGNAGFTKNWLRKYFTDKVLPDGKCVLVFDQDAQIVCASAPLKQHNEIEGDYIILRFAATRPGYEEAWRVLINRIAKICVETGWIDTGPLVVFSGSDHVTFMNIIEKLQPIKKPSYDLYVYKGKIPGQ
ncbi:MAG: hypothetical protein ACFFAJ_16980 [Candidatus Hodarchaeota archaeon]